MINLIKLTSCYSALLLLASVSITMAEDKIAPIKNSSATVSKLAYKDSSNTAPIVISNSKDLVKYVEGDELKKLQALDFKTVKVLVFAWQGSGGDQLVYEISKSNPEIIAFKYTGGLTMDIWPHQKVFILRNDVTWTTSNIDPLNALLKPITKLKVTVTEKAFADSSVRKPIKLTEKKSAKAYFEGEDLEVIEALNFDKVSVLIFAWRGSGQDKLSYTVSDADPQQVEYSYQPGRTRDLRSHSSKFFLRND